MNNLGEKIKEIEKQLEKLKKQLTEENKKDKYKRKRDDNYWFLNCIGESVMAYDYYEDEDNFNYNIGNYFETEEQAKNYKEKLLIEQELRDIARELNLGEEIDWDNTNQDKYYIEYSFYGDGILYSFHSYTKIQGTIYCLDINFKHVAIERIGKERLTKYLKGELD